MSLLPAWMRRRSDLYSVPADIIVYRDGAYAVAVNGKTKQVIHSDVNHKHVWEKAIDSVPENGKIVGLGEFNICELEITKSNIEIAGPTLYCDVDGSAIMIIGSRGSSDKIAENIKLRDMVFYGDPSKNVAGLDISAVDNVVVENIVFQNLKSRGFRPTVWSGDEYVKHNLFVNGLTFINTGIVLGGVEGGYLKNLYFTGTLLDGMNSWVDFSFGEWSNAYVKDVEFDAIFKDCDALDSSFVGVIAGLQQVTSSTIRIRVYNVKGKIIAPVTGGEVNGYSNKIELYSEVGDLGPSTGGAIPSWWYNTQATITVKGTTTYHGFSDNGQNSIIIANIEGAYEAGLLIGSNASGGIYIVNSKNNNVVGASWGDVHVYGSASTIIGDVGTLIVDGGEGVGKVGLVNVKGTLKYVNGGGIDETSFALPPRFLDTGLQSISGGATVTVMDFTLPRDLILIAAWRVLDTANAIWVKVINVTDGVTVYNVKGNWSEVKRIPAGKRIAIQLYNDSTATAEGRYLLLIY